MILRRGAAAIVAALLFVAGLVLPAAAAPGSPPTASRPVVVLIAVPGLQWSDVEGMPTLRGFVADSAVGELSVKTAGGVTHCSPGILAVTAGNRTTDVNGSCPILASAWPTLRAANAKTKYRTTIGLLGTTLRAAGVATIADGTGAAPLLADEDGSVTHVAPTFRAAITLATKAGSGAVVAALEPSVYYMLAPTPALRAAKAAEVDRKLATMLPLVPQSATVIVAGISDIASGRGHLHMVAIRGPGWAHTQLRSSAAGRAPFVQLIDIAPTILDIEHLKIPAVIVGRPMQQSRGGVPPISKYVDDDLHAVSQRTLGQRTFLTLGIAGIVVLLLTLLPWPSAAVGARWLARLLAPAPGLVFVMNALPWWRWGQPSYAALVVGGCVVIAGLTTLAARRGAAAAALVPLTTTFVALVLDQLTGAHLQFSAPLGDSPIVAGRFSGVGNLDFSEIATSALLLAGIVGGWIGGRRGALTAVAIALVAVVVDGAPQLGNDIGGVFALVPGTIVLAVLALGARLTWRRAVLAGLATAAVAVGLALVDYSRPATSQTHVGRFVGQVLHGGAGTEVHRKLNAALSTFGPTVGTFVVAIAIVAAIVSWPRLTNALASLPGLRTGAVAATVTAVLGVALNDSGVPIAAMAVLVGFSAVYGAIGGRDLAVAGGRSPLPPTQPTAGRSDGA
ncbi:MAG TPA: hypothetical protein VHC43_07980 [Mycobacteriales bacterium]|nr:hypothetical protein [Mycobacteriales bacterium]